MYKLPNITNNNIGDVFFMKKLLFIVSCLIGCLMLLVSCTNCKKETRIRILSSDYEESSICLKYEVRDVVLSLLKNISYQSKTFIVSYLQDELSKTFKENKISVTLEDVTFPAKVLDNKFIPSGTYETILIKIDEGLGSNWWSILYPEFFGTTYESSSEVEYRSYFIDLFK